MDSNLSFDDDDSSSLRLLQFSSLDSSEPDDLRSACRFLFVNESVTPNDSLKFLCSTIGR